MPLLLNLPPGRATGDEAHLQSNVSMESAYWALPRCPCRGGPCGQLLRHSVGNAAVVELASVRGPEFCLPALLTHAARFKLGGLGVTGDSHTPSLGEVRHRCPEERGPEEGPRIDYDFVLGCFAWVKCRCTGSRRRRTP